MQVKNPGRRRFSPSRMRSPAACSTTPITHGSIRGKIGVPDAPRATIPDSPQVSGEPSVGSKA